MISPVVILPFLQLGFIDLLPLTFATAHISSHLGERISDNDENNQYDYPDSIRHNTTPMLPLDLLRSPPLEP